MKYIGCDILGPGDYSANCGLGNQMFQIATLISLAKNNDATLICPNIQNGRYGGYVNNVFRNVNIVDININNFVLQTENSFIYKPVIFAPNTIYKGYFQSERYFQNDRKLVLKLFRPSSETLSYIYNKYNIVDKKTISIHIRRGDYLYLQEFHPVLSKKYYDCAIDIVNNLDNNEYQYVVFSDDILWCRQNLNYSNMVFIENESDYIDLYIMSLCTHNIIANSTFSWWGAWLNKNINKIVVAPKKWFGVNRHLQDKDIVPIQWMRI